MATFAGPRSLILTESKLRFLQMLVIALPLGALPTQGPAQVRRVVIEHDGFGYDAAGTRIGPLDLSSDEKLDRLQAMLGTRGTITRTDAATVRDALLVKLAPDSFGRLDGVVFRTGPWEQTLPLDDISEINAGGQVVVFGSHPRRMIKLREVQPSRSETWIATRERELAAWSKRLQKQEADLAALWKEREKRGAEESPTFEEAYRRFDREAKRLEGMLAELATREEALKSDARDLSVAKMRHEDSKRDWAKDHEREEAARREAIASRKRAEIEWHRRDEAVAKRESELSEREARVARREGALFGSVKLPDGTAVPKVTVKLIATKDGKTQIDQATTNGSGLFVMERLSFEEFRLHRADYRFEVSAHEFRFAVDVGGQLIVTVEKL